MNRHSKMLLTAGAAAAAGMISGCKLPPNVTWQNIHTHGLIPTLMGKGEPNVVKTPSPVKVEAVMSPRILGVPVGEPVPGRSGYVYSPFTPSKKVVDVRDFKAGEEVRCPLTLKPFIVPDFSKATEEASGLAQQETPKPGPEIVSTDPNAGLSPTKEEVAPETPPEGASEKTPSQEPKSAPAPDTGTPGNGPAVGRRVPGKPGFVYSPFASQYQLVDVVGIAPGVEVRCPYTGKLFRVPDPLPEEAVTKPVPATTPSPAPAPQAPPKSEEKQEQPKATPQPAPKETPPAPAGDKPAKTGTLPTAVWVQQDKGLVQSPFGQSGQLVDVTGKAPGSKAICPFTGKLFLVPAP
ncbi:MAG: hypothetical protein KA004_14380 [Verrucomicrobiales bacterium]|nr:hypothetical protein [Verrucomicrobiales bacterium]